MTSLYLIYVIVAFPLGCSLPAKGGSGSTTTIGFRMSRQELERLGITQEEVVEQIRLLLREPHRCPSSPRVKGSPGVRCNSAANDDNMLRYYIRNRTVTCNDGSRPGFYVRRSQHGSTRWIIFLEGGWLCFDNRSCHGRWLSTPHLMSSNYLPVSRKGSGILSWNSEENPFISDGNLVYVPYCSSDSWSGTAPPKQKGDFAFMGALILDEVTRDLFHLHGLSTASRIFLAGSSAGGTGVLLNIDRLAETVASLGSGVEVRGIADSGWFLDNKQFREVPCTDSHFCSPSESVRRGFQLWQSRLPRSCLLRFPTDQWKCYFGQNVYSSLQTVVFVVQYLFDEAQLSADNVGLPVSRRQWEYIRNIGQEVRSTLENVTALFAPACLSHMLLTNSEWKQSTIDGVSLPEALACWESEKHEFNWYTTLKTPQKHQHGQIASSKLRPQDYRRILSDQPVKTNKKKPSNKSKSNYKQQSKEKKKNRTNNNKKRQPQNNRKLQQRRRRPWNQSLVIGRPWNQSLAITNATNSINLLSRQKRSPVFFDQHDVHHIRYHGNRCSHRRLDNCVWPQCNVSCPRLRNPLTGKNMDYSDLLLQFGLNPSSVVDAIGVDLSTIETMDYGHLLHILIQSSL